MKSEYKIVWKRKYVTINVFSLRQGVVGLKYRYDPSLKDELKISLDEARWDPNKKVWSAKDSARTEFVLDSLERHPEALKRYDIDYLDFSPSRECLHNYQVNMFRHKLTRRRVVWAVDMGLGKTLTQIECMEWVNKNDPKARQLQNKEKFWVVCPKSVIRAWEAELKKWGAKVKPNIFNYEQLEKQMRLAQVAPYYVIFDESTRIKSPTAKRSQLALALSNKMHETWGYDSYVCCMTGTPQPKSESDWWHQCEVARPGFLKEANIKFFNQRLFAMDQQEGAYGAFPLQVYKKDLNCAMCERPEAAHRELNCIFTPKVKCGVCEKYHYTTNTFTNDCGMFLPSESVEDEVTNLVKRMEGLTISLQTQDCLELPPIRYETRFCSPSLEMYKAAELVAAQCTRKIELLTRLRQVSDGFIYNNGETINLPENPKLDALVSIIDEMSLINKEMPTKANRLVVYAGFKASIDLIIESLRSADWLVIAADGRGWRGYGISQSNATDITFRNLVDFPSQVAFVGHPASVGMGLNLQVTDTMIFYSNDFNAENRMQAEKRAHRQGMLPGGLRIIDLSCLGTDDLITKNLKGKRDAQDISLAEIKNHIMK